MSTNEFPTISNDFTRARKRQQGLQLRVNESAAKITEYENIIEGLQQQLTEVQAANVQAHIELNVAAFQLNRAADPLVVLQSTLQQKENEILSANERISELQADRTTSKLSFCRIFQLSNILRTHFRRLLFDFSPNFLRECYHHGRSTIPPRFDLKYNSKSLLRRTPTTPKSPEKSESRFGACSLRTASSA